MNAVLHKEKLNRIEEAYSSEPWWYDMRGFFILTFAYRSTLWNQIALFSKNMGENHLEVAIGSGTLFELILNWRKLLRKPKSQVTAFDYAPRMLAGAIKRFKNEPSVNLELADVTRMNFASTQFDTVNVANCLHCFPDIKSAICEIHRVLRRGGSFCGNVLLHPDESTLMNRFAKRINDWGIKKGILYTPYHQSQMVELLEKQGFKIEYSKVSGNCFDFVAKK